MAQSKEAYVVRSNDGGTITFYYDTKKSTHPSGYVYDIPSSGNTPDWAGTYEKPNETLTHAAMANPKTGYFTLNPTGIETTKADVEPHKKGVYTVGGIRVSGELKDQPKGIYIVNGKKVIK